MMMKRPLSLAFCVSALALAGGPAFAATAPAPSPTPRLLLYGGGSALHPDDGGRNDLFGFFASVVRGVRVSFCPAGSAFAKAVFTGSVSAAGPCAPAEEAPTGFGAPGTFADFVSSEIPLTTRDVAAFAAGAASRGEPVQIPYLATSVALLFDNPDVTGRLRLSIPTLCKIADGEIADWNRIPRDPTNPSGATYPRRPLHWVYRVDAAGTTFSLSNFLSSRGRDGTRTCRHRETFALNDTYVPGVLPRPLPFGATTSGFLGATGDAAAIDCIAGRPGRCARLGHAGTVTARAGTIGYVDPVGALAASLEPPLGVAELYVVRSGIGRDEDPIADLPGPATHITSYELDRVLADFVPNGRPPEELVAPLNPPQRPGCIAVVPPAAYAFPEVGYPIVSVVNADFASAGNGEKADPLRTLAALANDGKNFGYKKIRTTDADNVARGERGSSVIPLSTLRKHGIPHVAACIGP